MAAEEVLALDDIQGAIIPGFKKDFSIIVGLFIDDVAGCKSWLKTQAAEVARASDVLAFNRLFKAMRRRRGSEHGLPSVVWKSISFSSDGLRLLRPQDDIQNSFDGKFVGGMFNDSLGDPPGNEWKIGGSAQTVPHILIVLAADKQSDLDAETSRLINGIGDSGGGGLPALRLAGPAQSGATLPPPLRGHEHFGFKDGVSQPAMRGLISADPADFFDERLLSPADPNFDRFAEPGRPLVWPGQFLLGYQRQDPLNDVRPRPAAAFPLAWQKNGSYLVYRRLRQEVHQFWQFCETSARALSAASGQLMTREFFASRLVGRWSSGAPVIRAPLANDDQIAHDPLSDNNFRFRGATPVVTMKDGTQASSQFPAPVPDPDGRTCPFVGHIRKVNPRDDPSDTGGPRDTLRRLMLRRGIPYGPPKDRTRLFEDDGVDRGLLFMSYQGSITDQFHFITQTWANAPNSPHDSTPPTGQDAVIGQNAAGCFIRVPIDGDVAHDVELRLPAVPWVVMTGGGYFFTPSISALTDVLAQSQAGPAVPHAAVPALAAPLTPSAAAPPIIVSRGAARKRARKKKTSTTGKAAHPKRAKATRTRKRRAVHSRRKPK
jgi:Dyp-type peroxidase family